MAVPSVTSLCSGRSQKVLGPDPEVPSHLQKHKSKLALPTHSKAARGKGTGPRESTAVKRRFLAETFISVSKGRSIHSDPLRISTD